jgi:hypothetical protein
MDLIHGRVFFLRRDEIRIADAVTIRRDADEPERENIAPRRELG